MKSSKIKLEKIAKKGVGAHSKERASKLVHDMRSPLMSLRAGLELLKALEYGRLSNGGLSREELLSQMTVHLTRLDQSTKAMTESPLFGNFLLKLDLELATRSPHNKRKNE